MHAFYVKHNPTKLDEIPKLLEKYRGQEPELIRKLEKKYNVTPSVPTPSAPVCGFSSPIVPKGEGTEISTPIDITKSGWGNNVFSSTPSSTGTSGLFGLQGGGNTTPTPFAVPSTGPIMTRTSPSGTIGGNVSPFTGQGVNSSPSLFSGSGGTSGVGGGVSPFSLQNTAQSGITGFSSPSGLFRGNTTGGETGIRPPSGSGIITPFGAQSGQTGGMTSLGGMTGGTGSLSGGINRGTGGGLFSSQGTGGLFGGTQTPPRPVSGFSSVNGPGSFYGSGGLTNSGWLNFTIYFILLLK